MAQATASVASTAATSAISQGQTALKSGYDQIIQRMYVEDKNDQAVNEVMEEIDDQLESDEDDTAFLVTTNSGTGGNDVNAGTAVGNLLDYGKQETELEQYANLSPSQPKYQQNQDQYNYYDQNAYNNAGTQQTDAYYQDGSAAANYNQYGQYDANNAGG